MHCLGAVSSGSASPQRAGNCGSVLGVVRALGVLVSEGRVQGPPRGYKEGPHCAAPLQPAPNNHVCEKDNYLCDRYVILVRDIADRVTTCSYLCVEVLLCADCPCGLAKATCKEPIPSMSIGPWHQSSEMLLEYWCISVVPSKGPEMMNNQSLYQAVRSRLHFSQVAAWWSRSKGTDPSYITTRVVSFSEDNLRRFRETPSEHTFPLAACGDGNSVKVTVWALPRVEDVPVLNCPIHPITDKEDEGGTARASTPTKNITVPATSANTEALVLPTLVDDRLQTPCNEPGKHHCKCEDEDGCPPSPSVRANGERKRRRSLPRGPDFVASGASPHCASSAGTSVLSSVCELAACRDNDKIISLNCGVHQTRSSTSLNLPFLNDEQSTQDNIRFDNQPNDNGEAKLDRAFTSLLNEQESNLEKRYKCTVKTPSVVGKSSCDNSNKPYRYRREKSPKFNKKECLIRWDKTGPVAESRPMLLADAQKNSSGQSSSRNDNSMANINWTTSTISGKDTEFGYSRRDKFTLNKTVDTLPIIHSKANLVVNPFGESSPFHESNPGPSTHGINDQVKIENDSQEGDRDGKEAVGNNDLTLLMAKLKFPDDSEKPKDEKGILDWISKVPSRVFNVATNSTEYKAKTSDGKLDPAGKSKQNCNLELSQREFDEVLAVLRARTPAGRRRTPLRTVKRRDKLDRQTEEWASEHRNEPKARTAMNSNSSDCVIHNRLGAAKVNGDTIESRGADKPAECFYNVTNKADVLLGAILRTSKDPRKGLSDISNGARPRTVLPAGNFERKNFLGLREADVKTEQRDGGVRPFEDDRLLSSSLNKRISQLKQLFKKEQDKTDFEASTPQEYCEQYAARFNDPSLLNVSKHGAKESRVKRRIDFADLADRGESFPNQTRLSANGNAESRETEGEEGRSVTRNHGKNLKLQIAGHRGAENDCEDVLSRANRDGEKKNDATTAEKYQNDLEFENNETVDRGVPSAIEQERFRRSLGNAASMVFHSRTGLPLTSSPAPLRRGSCCFDYDSSLNSVSSKRSALFELNTPPSPGAVSLEEGDREAENICEGEERTKRRTLSRGLPHSHALLGSFEESALNGRLEPVSTVHGFTAELGASGSFCPKHRKLPVTVFFYTLGDNDKVSTPYLAHINLGKKGYQVPRSGTIQVTLLNPLGTVVKMFVVMYDLSDMPSRSHTFLRQRTLRDKTLRYLIHLRFMSGKSGRIYLHTDIRMIICRKSDVDTASDLGAEPPKELRSFVHGPTNPKFSPRC